jgi:hypothetical protein
VVFTNFFKYATRCYYYTDKVNGTKEITSVCDNKGNLVETMNKKSNGCARFKTELVPKLFDKQRKTVDF